MLQQLIDGLKSEEDVVNCEYRVRHKDGTEVVCYGTVRQFLQKNAEPIIQRSMVDVTDVRRTDSRMRQMSEMQEQILGAFPIGILAYTIPEHKVLVANEEMYRIFNYDVDMVRTKAGLAMAERIYPEDVPAVREATEKLKNVGDEVKYMFRTVRGDGGLAHVSCTTRLRAFDNGDRYILSAMHDVTKEFSLNEKLRLERRSFGRHW